MTTKHLRFPAGTSEAEMVDAIVSARGFIPGAIVQFDVLHDDGCPKLDGRGCSCEPETLVKVVPPEGTE